MTGDLAELALADLIEMTALGGKTGVLSLRDGAGTPAGELAFRDGKLVGATSGDLTAERAFHALLALACGSFTFDPDAEPRANGGELATHSLLVEGLRRCDETTRLRQFIPATARVRFLGGASGGHLEARVLARLGPGARSAGDIVAAALTAGDATEFEVLSALSRLEDRGVVLVERSADEEGQSGGPAVPQPELER